MAHLEQLLATCPSSKRKLVITDSLFSMDGDFADLHGLVSLRRQYGFALALDEAHATLVAGHRYVSLPHPFCCVVTPSDPHSHASLPSFATHMSVSLVLLMK